MARIIGPPSAARPLVLDQAMTTLGGATRFGAEMFAPLWDAAVAHTIDPVGVIAQAFKETGGGHFRGQVRWQFYNTAGIKHRHTGLYPGIDDGDQPNAHARFASWEVGALAQVQHLRAYAGWPVQPPALVVDPRYWLVVAAGHRLEQWSELGGKWAPSPTYGAEVEAIMRRLRGETV